MNWSKEQLQAIQSCNTNELVNAGAGSGKTAVLSEHVMYLLKNCGYKIENFLILTFTNLAANEMKQRIKSKILKDEELSCNAHLVDAAHIETFDAFCLFLVKKYHYLLNIDKNINIIDKSILDIEKRRILNNILNDYYNLNDGIFIEFVKTYCIKNDDLIIDLTLALDKAAGLSLDKDKYLKDFLNNFSSKEFILKQIDAFFKLIKTNLDIAKQKAKLLEDLDDCNNIIEFIDNALCMDDYDSLYDYLSKTKFPTKPKNKTSDVDFRGKIKDIIDKIKKYDLGKTNDILQNQLSLNKYISLIVSICQKMNAKLDIFKKKFNYYSFHDIASFALKITENKDILDELKNTFKYIMIDEYQDTSDIQEALILRLSDNNAFMVGDVKQSIYRFRNANCKIFQDKYIKFSQLDGGHRIDMSNNFRSRKEVIDDFNNLFSQLMKPSLNIIDYEDGHNTNFGNILYESNKVDTQDYGIHVYKYEKDTNLDRLEQEARIIAEDIVDKIHNKYQIFDSKLNTLRDCGPSDFAIILDRSTIFDTFSKVFAEYQIPLMVIKDDKLDKKETFIISQNMLIVYQSVLNNTYDDKFIHAYVSLLRSFVFEYDDKTIYEILTNKSFHNETIIFKFKELVSKSKSFSVKDILSNLYDVFHVYDCLYKIGNYNEVNYDLKYCLSLMDNLDSFNYTLSECIAYFDDLKSFETEIESPALIDNNNSAILLTIHKSKGLEFSICYYAGLFKKFVRDNAKSNVSNKFGMYFEIISDTSNGNNLLSILNNDDEQKELFEEKLRLLYVAITRAKEEAIIILDKEMSSVNPIHYKNETFNSILAMVDLKNIHDVRPFNNTKLFFNEINIKKDFHLKTRDKIEYSIIKSKKASKEIHEPIDESVLDFGIKMHMYLEMVDFDNKDLSFIKDDKFKKYVLNVVNLDIFKGAVNENIRREFAFYDDKQKMNGIIDCLLIKEKEIDIVDYKLKNIDDEAYKKQLEAYRQYIERISDKIVKTYLVSIIDGTYKEVK